MALVLGIYERLVSNIHEGASVLGRAIKGDPRSALDHLKRVEWLFLIPLLTGIGAAVLSLAHVIEVAALNQRLKMLGHDAAKELDEKLIGVLSKRRRSSAS